MATPTLPTPSNTSPASRRSAPRPRTAQGVTMVECLAAVSILATTLGLAVPSLDAWKQRQALMAVAAEVETDIQYARSIAVAQSTMVRMESQPLGAGSCYLLHTGAPRQCRCTGQGQSQCTGTDATVLRLAELPADGPVRLLSNKVSIGFNPNQGTVTPTATFQLADRQGRAIHQVVSIMGRVRSCTPLGSVKGFKSC